jgi:hypothetical protein
VAQEQGGAAAEAGVRGPWKSASGQDASEDEQIFAILLGGEVDDGGDRLCREVFIVQYSHVLKWRGEKKGAHSSRFPASVSTSTSTSTSISISIFSVVTEVLSTSTHPTRV